MYQQGVQILDLAILQNEPNSEIKHWIHKTWENGFDRRDPERLLLSHDEWRTRSGFSALLPKKIQAIVRYDSDPFWPRWRQWTGSRAMAMRKRRLASSQLRSFHSRQDPHIGMRLRQIGVELQDAQSEVAPAG
jgi:hypothetical protein